MIRDRTEGDSYREHVQFMKRCRMIINISDTGSGQRHHVKGRILEAGFAGCALLEDAESPIGDWFPPDCYITYRDPRHAAELIEGLPDEAIDAAARALAAHVREHYGAAKIYGEIIERAGLVDHPFAQSAV